MWCISAISYLHFLMQSSRYSLGMGLNYQQLLKNVPMGAGGFSDEQFFFETGLVPGMGGAGLFPR